MIRKELQNLNVGKTTRRIVLYMRSVGILFLLLFIVGIGNVNADAYRYGRGRAFLKEGCPNGAGKAYVTVASSETSSNSGWKDCTTDGVTAEVEGAKTAMTFTFQSQVNSGYKFTGWYSKNADGTYKLLTKETTYSTKTTTGAAPTGVSDVYTDVDCYAEFIKIVNYSFIVPEHGSFSITNNGVAVANYATIEAQGVVHLKSTPATGYRFAGWYTSSDGGTTKNYFSFDSETDLNFTTDVTVGVTFLPDNGNALYYVVNSGMYDDLTSAINQAQNISPKTIVVVQDGNVPAGNYTIPSGVTLYVPYSKSNSYQTKPTVVTAASALNPYRVLTLQNGVNITCNGNICVGGQIMSAGGGKTSAYPTGACGVIDMSKGGNITLNNGAKLYCWGFIKGQDMEQGNNTVGAGSIIAKSGAEVWEMFAVGDWRGGTACSTIQGNSSSWRFFPFQSYTIQNIEVQTTYEYGSTLSNYTNVYGDGSTNEGSFALIGSTNTLFLLKDSESKLKKWYDPTTDLVCYEMSGTTQLDAINISVMGISVSSEDYNLPISSSMHVIMNSNATISKPMVVQAGAVIEVKSGYTLTCSSDVYIFDKDNWGEYCNKKYYYTMSNLSNHKNRGNGTSNELIDDAKLIIDGTLNMTGNMYTTEGGADIMSNGGGEIVFSTLPTATNIVMCTGVSDNEDVPVASANLHNEDNSYTQVKNNNSTFYNVNGRWFVSGKQNEKTDHTYDFTYISSGAVSGSGGTTATTDAVYTWDKKASLDLTQKWHNVSADACANWWVGTDTYFYNWTENSAWHQFIPTATAGMYSGSNNKIYTKTDCTWEELGETDVNCLYTIGGVKKALVDGEFIALEPNNNDPAYHAADDATKYYICFEGCNWHAADKYTEAEKAYVVGEDIFIWYNGVWMKAEWKDPFFYTLSETDVPIYYEYLNGEWVLAEPYVSVVDGIESRTYWFLEDAFTFANSVLRTAPTIKILRDYSRVTNSVSYTGANKTCTLDLNGHTLELEVVGAGTSEVKMFNINAPGTTFTITDNSDDAKGELRLIAAPNTAKQSKRWHGVFLTDGTLVLNAGKVYVEDNFKYTGTSDAGMVSGITIAAGKTFTMNGGSIDAYASYNVMGVQVNGAAGVNATVKIKGGTIHAQTTEVTSAYGMYIAGGTTTITGGKIEARTKTTTAIGVATVANKAGYYGTLNMTGGEIDAISTTTTAYGVQVGEGIAYSSGNVISNRVQSQAVISGGTIRATSTTTKSSSHTVGVRSLGTTNIIGGTIECNATQSIAYGVYAVSGTTTVSGNPMIIVRAPTQAYGACAGLTPADKTGVPYNGHLEISGGKFDVAATTSTSAYGVLVQALGRAINYTTKSGYYPGNYVSAGSVTISGGEFDVQARTTTVYGIFVKGALTQTGAKLDADGNIAPDVTSAPPICSVTGGKFKMSGTGSVFGTNNVADNANYQIAGGYYSHDSNLEAYAIASKHAVALQETDANYDPYFYQVAESYNVTFKNGDEVLQSSYQEVGKTPIYNGDAPTKASTSTTSYIFDGWSTTDGGAVVSPLPNVTSAGATYYAHYTETALKYIATFDAKTNGGAEENQVIYVEPDAAIGTLPTATKEGYTFSGWFTAASGGTKITTATVPTGDVTYYAQFTVNKYTLTWELGNGVVSAVGKYGSTSWPAKKATGTQSKAVSYGLTLTAPTVTRTGYTFHSWAPLVAATMPAEAVTYTAQWTPKTNTAYTVKHYQQNADGTYPEEPVETEALTGTTGESVTPEVKEYEGFVSPETETKEIAADGTMVIEYKYERMHYTITLDAATNGGMSEQPTIEVIHGATIGTVPPDAEKGCNDFTGWYTKPVGGVKITSDFTIEYNLKTLYAQFSDDVRKYTITYSAGANGRGSVAAGTKTCGVNTTLSSSMFTRTGYTQTGWSLTDGGAQAYALGGTYTANASLTLYPVWTINKYTITWKNGSTIIETDENVNYGTTPSFDGTNPTKPIDASYSYTFDGWSTTDGGAKVDPLPAVSCNTIYYAHYSTTPTVASVTVGGSTTYYTDFATAWAFVQEQTANTTIKLLQDATVTTSMVFTPAATMTCTFDLNNHTLSGAINKLVDVNLAGSTFIITDNSEDKNGKISTELSTNARLYSVFLTAGTLNLKAGHIHSKNPHTYSSAAANKNAAATGLYVTKGQKFTMDGGVIESTSQYASYALYMARGTSTVKINNGLVKGQTTKSTTAAGIYNLGKGLTVNGGRIVGHAYTTNAYGIYLYGGHGTINGGTIEATNDTTSSKGTTTTYGIYVNYYNSTYKGVLTIPSTSTVNVLAKARTTTSYAIVVGGSSTGSTIAGGTFTAKTKTGKTAYAVNSSGNITISGGTFIANSATTNAYGLYSARGTITVSGNPTFNVTSGTSTAYGALAYGTIGKKGTGKYSGTIKINGGTFNVTSTSTDAYGALAGLTSRDLRSCSATNDTVPGLHYMPGILEITNGTFNVKAKTTAAYGVHVAAAKNESGDVGTTTRIPLGTITGGKFKMESMGDANATAYAMTTTTTAARLVVQGGYYSTKAISATANIEDKYTAPKKDCNYHVLPLTGEDPYKYEVAEAYSVTFKNGDEVLQSTVVKKGATPSYTGAIPTKTEDENYTYTFTEWSPAITAATADATYTAAFTQTQKQKDITLKENGDNDYYDTFKAAYDGKTMNVTYKRQFAEGRWSTMCLPFNVNYATMKTFGMYGCVYEFKYAEGNANIGEGVNLYFSNAKSVEAGKCYIVNANSALETKSKTPFVFAGVTIDLSKDNGAALDSKDAYDVLPGYKSQGTIELVGTLRNGTLQGMESGNKYMGLKSNKIYYPNTDSGSTIWAYRGIFRSSEFLDKESMQKMRIIVDGEDRGELILDADGDVRAPSGAASRKFIENGVLYIEREGAVYDATGRKVE